MRATVIDQSKREFLVKSTSAVGAVGLSLVAAPFFAQPTAAPPIDGQPSAEPTIDPGESNKYRWRGTPMW